MTDAPDTQKLIGLLANAHTTALALRSTCGRKGLQALYAVVIVALDSAIVFARQADETQTNINTRGKQ